MARHDEAGVPRRGASAKRVLFKHYDLVPTPSELVGNAQADHAATNYGHIGAHTV